MTLDLNKLSIHSQIPEATSNQVTEISAKDIAVIGMALNLPGAKTPDQLWENLACGLDLITDFPDTRRKDTDDFLRYCGADIHTIKYKPGAYLDRIDGFDDSFFGLAPKEASLMSPEQRLFLETVWKAIEDAGYGGERIYGSKTGVFLGYNADLIYDYKRIISEVEPESLVTAMPANLTSVIPSRISYILDLKGPAMSIDTACSSSLVAVHQACRSLRYQESDLAIAGSVKLMILPVDSGQRLGIESADGRARSFDENADGTGMGEGVAAVILKPLNRALADGDHIYAVIKGSAINQDGRSIGITAPNAAAQAEVITAAWEDAGIEPETISYIEAHGTGTKLGDPIEIDGLSRAFAKYTQEKHFCAIGSLKTNIGHLDNAAGIAGLIKAILALQHKEIPPSLHFNRPNRGIDFNQAPVYVNTRLTDWNVKEGIPRRCGVSAFGLSGTNCHVILEEAPEALKQSTVDQFNILTLSAKTQEAFANLIREFSKYLEDKTGVNPAEFCYTANTGRWHYQYRLAVIFESREELQAILHNLARNENREIIPLEGVYVSENLWTEAPKKSDDTVEVKKAVFKEEAARIITQYRQNNKKESLFKLGELYAKGADIDWAGLYSNQRYLKISLPGYPFDPKRCWLRVPETVKTAGINPILRRQPERPLPEVILTGTENGGYSLTEKTMGAVWAEVLGLNEIDVNRDFYELGGDSIIALKIANRFKDVTGKRLEINQIMQYSALKKLATAIDELSETKTAELVEIKQAEPKDFYPLSSAQMRMYILNQFEGVGTSYNMPMAIKVEGVLDFARLNQTMQQLIARHEILRTSFKLTDGAPVQEIHQKVEFQAELVDLGARGDNHEKPEDLIKSLIKPFDLSRAPLLRAYVLKVSEAEQIIFFDMPHIITDGISSVIFDQELIALYQGKELPTSAREIRIQYKDYAVWQNQQLTSGALKAQEEYWLDKFSDEIPVLNLPTDFPRPAVQSFEGDRVLFKADRELTGEIIRLAEKTDTTLYMVLLAAYNVLLAKYTWQEDIVIASPVAGRNRTELERIIGIFVNTVLMRNYPGPDKTFLEFLREVKQNALEAYENHDYPFETLISRLNPVRDLSRNPLFDTMLTLQNTEKINIDTGSLKFRQLEFENKIAKFDLNLNITLENDELKFDLEYCAKLFRRNTIQRMAQHFINVFKEITRSPGKSIAQITILTEAERKQLLFDYNDTAVSYPVNITVHELFQRQVKENPQAIAVAIGNQSLSYGELNRKSNQLARSLRDKGVGADTVVAISAERSLELIIGIMGILKAGGAYLPIDPELPEERVGFLLEDSGAKILLVGDGCVSLDATSRDASGTINNETLITVLNLKDEELYQAVGMDLENINHHVQGRAHILGRAASDLAYVIYTSGSTGRPKGVTVEHRSLVNFLYCIAEKFDGQVGPGDNCLSLTSISFDVSVCEIFLPLAFGAKLVLYEMPKPDILHLRRSLIENAITFAYIPPALLNDLPSLLKPYGDKVKLNKMLVGVEPILDQTLAEFLQLNEAMRIINGYGPTEATICATFYKFDFRQPADCRAPARTIVPIGKPLSNTRIYLLDQGNNPVPEGVPGELCIAGYGLSRGYLNRPELTTEKFISLQFTRVLGRAVDSGQLNDIYPNISPCALVRESIDSQNQPEDIGFDNCQLSTINCQLYKTGDLARWAPDGNIEFLGRMDYQVKIRGYRIELGEIEAQLLKYEGVQEAVVVARGDGNGATRVADAAGADEIDGVADGAKAARNKYLCAYLSADRELTTQELRAYLSGVLPEYMVPSYYIQLPKLPLTTNGKINRKALPEPDVNIQTGAPGRDYEAPRNDLEIQLAVLWGEVLGVNRVGIHDNFFEIGGHSILATNLISKLHQVFSVETPLRQIFQTPTIAGLAEYLVKAGVSFDTSGTIAVNYEKVDYSTIVDNSNQVIRTVSTPTGAVMVEPVTASPLDPSVTWEPRGPKELKIALQREVSTYLGYSLPLCIILAYEKMLPWYYQHFIQISAQIGRSGYVMLDYVEPALCRWDIVRMTQIPYFRLDDGAGVLEFIKGKLSCGYYIFVYIDEYYFPAKTHYQKTHFVHETLVYGYDDYHQKLLVIGFDSNDIINKLEIAYDNFIQAFDSGKIHYEETASYAKNQAVELFRLKKMEDEFPFNLELFLSDLEEYLQSKCWNNMASGLLPPGESYAVLGKLPVVYGYDVQELVIFKMRELLQGKVLIDYRAIHLLAEHKKGLHQRLKYAISKCQPAAETGDLLAGYEAILQQIQTVRIKFMELAKTGALSLSAIEPQVKQSIEILTDLKQKEKIILTEIY